MKVIVALKATWKLFYYKSNWRYGLECMSNLLRYMTRFLYSSIEMMFLVSDQIFYFLITPLKVLCAIDVAVKSYDRKCSESSEIVVTTISELSLHFRAYLFKATSLGPKMLQEKSRGFLLI